MSAGSWVSAACALLLLPAWTSSVAAENLEVFVVRRGWHVDIGFPMDQLRPPLDAVAAEFPGARYVLFGFGDRRYLAAAHHGIPSLLRALWPGDGLLLATGLSGTPQEAFGEGQVRSLSLASSASVDTQMFVWHSLTATQQQQLSSGRAGIPGPYDGSVYFASRDTYSAAHTCNTWAAEALHVSHPTLKSQRVLFASQLWRKVGRMKDAGP